MNKAELIKAVAGRTGESQAVTTQQRSVMDFSEFVAWVDRLNQELPDPVVQFSTSKDSLCFRVRFTARNGKVIMIEQQMSWVEMEDAPGNLRHVLDSTLYHAVNHANLNK